MHEAIVWLASYERVLFAPTHKPSLCISRECRVTFTGGEVGDRPRGVGRIRPIS